MSFLDNKEATWSCKACPDRRDSLCALPKTPEIAGACARALGIVALHMGAAMSRFDGRTVSQGNLPTFSIDEKLDEVKKRIFDCRLAHQAIADNFDPVTDELYLDGFTDLGPEE